MPRHLRPSPSHRGRAGALLLGAAGLAATLSLTATGQGRVEPARGAAAAAAPAARGVAAQPLARPPVPLGGSQAPLAGSQVPLVVPLPLPAAVRAAALPRSQPVRLQIPAIGVDSGLVGLGLQQDGTMAVPAAGFPAGWYTGAPTPGELGPAVLAGHVDWDGRAGVFARLHLLRAGAEVTVGRQDGTTAVFRVTRVEQFAKNAFPTARVYGNLDHAGLRLITCGGSFDRRVHSYTENVIAFADLVRAGSA